MLTSVEDWMWLHIAVPVQYAVAMMTLTQRADDHCVLNRMAMCTQIMPFVGKHQHAHFWRICCVQLSLLGTQWSTCSKCNLLMTTACLLNRDGCVQPHHVLQRQTSACSSTLSARSSLHQQLSLQNCTHTSPLASLYPPICFQNSGDLVVNTLILGARAS